MGVYFTNYSQLLHIRSLSGSYYYQYKNNRLFDATYMADIYSDAVVDVASERE